MEMKTIKILSLFDGISIARQAITNCGIKIDKYYASEIDKYAIQIAQKNFPDTIQLGDVKNIKGEDFKDIDLIIGGSPCQDLSIAKKNREGLSGARSGLFYEYVRILNEVKPKYFILENVNSMPKEAKETITKELFGIEPIMINAALVSAQNRKRLFWVGKLVGDKYEQVKMELPEDEGILLKDILEDGVGVLVKNQGKEITFVGNLYNKRIFKEKSGTIGTIMGRTAKQGIGVYKEDFNNFIRKLTPIECERLQSLPDNYTEGVSNTQRYKALGNGFNCKVIEHIIKNLK